MKPETDRMITRAILLLAIPLGIVAIWILFKYCPDQMNAASSCVNGVLTYLKSFGFK